MVPQEPFSQRKAGLFCPMCLGSHYVREATRDVTRGIRHDIYRCLACDSLFGDARDFGDPTDDPPESDGSQT